MLLRLGSIQDVLYQLFWGTFAYDQTRAGYLAALRDRLGRIADEPAFAFGARGH